MEFSIGIALEGIHGTLGFLQVFTCAKQFLFVGIVHGPEGLGGFSVKFQLLGEKPDCHDFHSFSEGFTADATLINITLGDHNGGKEESNNKGEQGRRKLVV